MNADERQISFHLTTLEKVCGTGQTCLSPSQSPVVPHTVCRQQNTQSEIRVLEILHHHEDHLEELS